MTVTVVRDLPPHRLAVDLMRSLVLGDLLTARTILEDKRNDINRLSEILARRRLAGYLHTLIGDAGLGGYLPRQANHTLADSYRRQVNQCESSLGLLKAVQREMIGASVPFLTMKGFYLAQRYLGDFRRRFMWDIDILVHGHDLDKAITAISKTGLRVQLGAAFNYRRNFWGIHALEARGEAGKIDIHHAIRTLPGIKLDHDRIWRSAQEFTIDGTRFATLGDEDTLFTAAIGLSTDIQTSHHRLRKIWDIYMMLRSMDEVTDWDSFFSDRQKEGSLGLVINAISFCILLTGAKGDFPELNKAMARRRESVVISTEHEADTIYLRGRQNLANRVLFSRMLPTSPLNYWFNWLTSLPVRSWHFRRMDSRRHTRRSR